MSTPLFDAPISTEPPLALFPRRDNHPVSRAAVVGMDGLPVPTNKWYANLFLGTQQQAVWPLPYVLWVTKDASFWGLSISHADASQFALGPDANRDPVQFVLSPLGIRSFTFSATEFNPSSSTITVDTPLNHSVNLNLHVDRNRYGSTKKKIMAPLVQGMAFCTAFYDDLVPVIGSGVMFRSVTSVPSPRGGIQKWRIQLEDGKHWLLYACPSAGVPWVNFTQHGNSRLVANQSFSGFIQIAKLSDLGQESAIDGAAGSFPTTTTLSGTVTGTTGTYTLRHNRYGQNNAGRLLMYALPHHLSSFNSATAAGWQPVALQTPTKGLMRGVLGDSWTMVESNLPTGITWLPSPGNECALRTAPVANAIRDAATRDLQQDMQAQSDLDSMYFSGKALGKFAQIVLALTLSNQSPDLARSGLRRLQEAMGRFTDNRQKFPLVYDRTWRGLVSDAMYRTGDPNVDFGNSYYNDHHFHYGYFVYTAAVITHCERVLNNNANWVTANRNYINNLVRDFANPHQSDTYYPVSRSFDWWNGHSWAKGVFESGDGKDQESTSEDYNAAYAIKLWGMVTSNTAMEGRGNLMLAIMRRSMNEYFLLSNNNQVHPPKFIKNKVTGILFENKVDHATYFGMNIEYIQGIHMIPLTPVSPYIRSATFTREEWDQWFSNGRTANINDGWRGILMANVAIFDPGQAWSFFTQPGFRDSWLDGGASKTWYLAFVGCLGGATR